MAPAAKIDYNEQHENLKVSIPTAVIAFGRTELVVYYMVHCTMGSKEWVVYRRYSDFEGLQRELLGLQIGGKLQGLGFLQMFTPLPALPHKVFFSTTNTSRRLVEKRRVELDDYLRRAVAVAKDDRLLAAVLQFLEPAEPGKDPLFTNEPTPAPIIARGGMWVQSTVVETQWQAPALRTPPTVLVCLPWARQQCRPNTTACCIVIKSTRGEKLSVVRARYQEFCTFCHWVLSFEDRIPSCHEAMWYLGKVRQQRLAGNAQPPRAALHRSASFPPPRPDPVELPVPAIPRSVPSRMGARPFDDAPVHPPTSLPLDITAVWRFPNLRDENAEELMIALTPPPSPPSNPASPSKALKGKLASPPSLALRGDSSRHPRPLGKRSYCPESPAVAVDAEWLEQGGIFEVPDRVRSQQRSRSNPIPIPSPHVLYPVRS